MRIGLIGLGRIGAFHADTLAALDRVDELVVTDPVAAARRRRHRADRQGHRRRRPEALLDAGVDGVVIAATTGAHAELLLASAGRGIPTFCEKPIAGTADEAVTVRDRLAGSDVPVQIGYPRRFDPAFVAARDAVRAGELGRVHTVRSTTLDPAPPPAAYLAGSGGIFRDCSVHDFDAVRWVTGRRRSRSSPSVRSTPTPPPSSTPTTATGRRPRCSSRSTTARSAWSRTAAPTPAATTCASRCTGWRMPSRPGLDEGLPLRPTQPGISWPAGPPHSFFMDRLTEAFRRELATFCAVAAGEVRLAVHHRGRHGHRLDRRGRDAVGERAPPGAHRRGRPLTHPCGRA